MTTSAAPNIRTKTLDGGKQRFEARLKRGGIELSGTFKTEAEAKKFGTTVDTLLDSGMSAQECKAFLKVKKSATVTPLPSPGIVPLPQPAADQEGRSVGEAIQAYITHRQNSHEPISSNYLTDYERVKNDFGGFPLSELRNEDISNYISKLLKTPVKADAKRIAKGTLERPPRLYAEATVRKFVTALRIALEWNAKNSKVELNKFLFDFDKKTMPAAWDVKRERRLTKEEEAKLYAAGISRGGYTYTSDDWRHMIGFALETAMRQQEISRARWKDITEDGLKLRILRVNSKSKIDRTILLSKRARELVELQRAICPKDEQRIFHQFPSTTAICHGFVRLTKRANIEHLHFHDLRHEATSRLCISGKLPMMAIMEMTGHKSMTTFRGYVHLITHGNELRLD
jgi:integrase